MKKTVFTFVSTIVLFGLFPFAGDAQTPLTVNFDEIKEAVDNKDYYNDILRLYQQDDEMLRVDDYALLYYGQSFLPAYNGGSDVNEQTMKTFMNESNYEKAYKTGLKILTYNPVCINALFNVSQAARKLNKPQEEIASYEHKYWALLYLLSQSGTGKSITAPYKVISPIDQYYLIYGYFEIEDIYSHELDMEHFCNIFKVSPNANFAQELLYVDISRYLLETAKEIKK